MEELINGRTPEQIKTGLGIHAEWGQCKTCPYNEEKRAGAGHCIDLLTKDVYKLIEHLEAKLAEKDERIEALREMME